MAHLPLARLKATAPPELATVRVEHLPEPSGEYRILVSPRPDLPVGPFRFEVRILAVEPDGSVHPCASVEVYGEMQPTTRVFPKVILLGERKLGEAADSQISVRLPTKDWKIDRIEADSEDIAVSNGQVDENGESQLGVIQKITGRRPCVAMPYRDSEANGGSEVVAFEVRYYGRSETR